MDHRSAIELHAAERYLLGEMSGSEREAFEEHFFECQQCARDVRTGALLVENLKSGAAWPPHRPVALEQAKPARWWQVWLEPRMLVPTFAAFVFAILSLVLWQRSIPAQGVPAAVLLPVRSSVRTINVFAEDQFVHLTMDVNDSRPFERYECRIENDAGQQVSKPFAVRVRDQRLTLLAPAGIFSSGRYTLVARGIEDGRVAGDPLAFVFQIERNP
jgi:hypothetical protein